MEEGEGSRITVLAFMILVGQNLCYNSRKITRGVCVNGGVEI